MSRTLRRRSLFAGLVLSLFVIAACTDSNGEAPPDDGALSPSPATPLPATPSPTASADETGTPAASTATPQPGGDLDGMAAPVWHDSVLELRDGTWQVGDAGEVEFAVVDGNRLELLDVRPADGWTETDRDIDADEIEVDFQRGNVEWEIEIEIENGILEIEIDQDIEGGEPGIYTVGLAGTVEFDMDDTGLVLVEVVANDGWSYTVEEEQADEIEVDFWMDNVTWDFEVELDDGVLEIEIDFEIEGRYPV